MWYSVHKTDEVSFQKCTSMRDEDCETITKKIKDLDKPEIDLLMGELIGKCRRFEEKSKELKDRMFRELLVKGEFDLSQDDIDDILKEEY